MIGDGRDDPATRQGDSDEPVTGDPLAGQQCGPTTGALAPSHTAGTKPVGNDPAAVPDADAGPAFVTNVAAESATVPNAAAGPAVGTNADTEPAVVAGGTGALAAAGSELADDVAGPPADSLRIRAVVTKVVVRLTEIALIIVGLWFVLVAEDDGLGYLAIWDGLAIAYVGLGFLVLRRTRLRPPTPDQSARLERFRFNFFFAIVASLIGFSVAIEIATSDYPPDEFLLLNILGVIAMVMSWMLLQAGYARRYSEMIQRGHGGLTFPSTDHPAPVDFLYFAVTIGTAFSVSDVLVTTTRMRWHVMVHSVLSFFYNAAVVAFALNLIAGR